MKDVHVHSTVSHDGISTFEEYFKQTKEIGVMKLLLQNIMMFMMELILI